MSEEVNTGKTFVVSHGGYAEIFQDRNNDWYLRLVAPNGETIMVSEAHKNLFDVRKLYKRYFPTFEFRADEAVTE